jgi:flagellin
MGAYLYTNVASLAAQRNLANSQDMLKVSTERLSSGKRINSAKDDAAGAGISKRFTGNVQGLRQGVRNAADGAAMADAGEAALEQIAQMTLRIRELGVQAQNETYSTSDLTNINNEVQSLYAGITGLATNAKYNSIGLLDGSAGITGGKTIKYTDEVGGGTITITTAKDFKVGAEVAAIAATPITDKATASTMVTTADTLLTAIATARSDFSKASVTLGYVGAAQSALAEAVDSARSRIEDTDYAAETAKMTRNQILQQAATAALAQANAMPNTILSLIK